MAGVAVASIGYFAARCISTKSFQPLGLFFLVPDMLWSGIDMGIQVQHETNPDARRFTFAPLRGSFSMKINVSFQPTGKINL